MANRTALKIISLVFFTLFFGMVYSDEVNLGELFFDKGVNEYLKGGRDDAIKSLEKSLKYAPDNYKAKRILVRLLVQRSAEYFYAGELEKSFIDIKQAKTIMPRDSQVERLYGFVKTAFDERYKPPGNGGQAAARQEQKEIVKYMAGSYLESNPYNGSGGLGFSRTEMTYIIAAFAVGILLLFLAVLAAFDRYSLARKQEIYSQRVELERVMWAVKEGKNCRQEPRDPAFAASLVSAGLSKAPAEMERILKNPMEIVRAKGLIILEAEMMAKRKFMAMRLLIPLLDDKDPMIMANAARALCRHDAGRGMAVLEKMAAGERQQKTAALHAMGWLNNDRAANALMKAMSDRDGKVASAALKGLKLMHDRKFAGLSAKAAAEASRQLSLVMIKQG